MILHIYIYIYICVCVAKIRGQHAEHNNLNLRAIFLPVANFTGKSFTGKTSGLIPDGAGECWASSLMGPASAEYVGDPPPQHSCCHHHAIICPNKPSHNGSFRWGLPHAQHTARHVDAPPSRLSVSPHPYQEHPAGHSTCQQCLCALTAYGQVPTINSKCH